MGQKSVTVQQNQRENVGVWEKGEERGEATKLTH